MPLGSLPLVIGSGLLAELDGFARRQDQDPLETSVPPAAWSPNGWSYPIA